MRYNFLKTSFLNRFCLFLASFLFLLFLSGVKTSEAATLSLSPSSGSFVVGDTFDVSVFLDTQGESVNAVEINLVFPADKLQVVSPNTGQSSIVGIWMFQPQFNNSAGTIKLQGGIPNGIITSKGQISSFTFRVKAVGSAAIKFLDSTRVLLNDGLGSDGLKQVQHGVYSLVLPPPAGPIVVSETHSDQTRWHPNSTVVLKWNNGASGGYSYVLNNEPLVLPDDISEGSKNFVIYKNLSSGVYYFHIKSLRDGAWGGSTHFSVKIDNDAPAEFLIEILPHHRTTARQPVIKFFTTDAFSGLDHYELKIIPLSRDIATEDKEPSDALLFIEAESPFIPRVLELGNYDVVVRAYDKAGNYREVVRHFSITGAIFRVFGDQGLLLSGRLIVPWSWAITISVILTIVLVFGSLFVRRWHRKAELVKLSKELPRHVQGQLDELKKYRSKYGKAAIFIFILLSGLFFGGSVFAQQAELGPPLVSIISRNVSNQEIFYIGGKTEASKSKVIIYLQGLHTGETFSQEVESDKLGNWFYRHPTFLSTGNYRLWVQAKVGDILSTPSPEILLTVRATAIQFGGSRISYESLYLGLAILFLFIVLGLLADIIFHHHHGRKKHGKLYKEIKEAEESVRRGFAVLKRDIEAELAVIKKVKLGKDLAVLEKQKEEQLLDDLSKIERYIGKEIWDVEREAQ